MDSQISISLTKISASSTHSNDECSVSQPNLLPQSGNSLPKDRNSRTYKLHSLWSITSQDIGIPKTVVETLQAQKGFGLQSLPAHYEYTCSVEARRAKPCSSERILWKFLTTQYYDISQLDGTKRRCSSAQDSVIGFIVAAICEAGRYDPDTVRKRVTRWVNVGRRYHGFMQALSSGCVIIFPEKISDLVWEQYMPMKGDIFNKAIKFLQALGIVKQCQEEGWNDLSDKILQALRVPFRSIISIPFEPDQQSQMEYSATQGPVDASMHRPTPSMLGDMGTNNVLPKLSEIGLLEIKWPHSHLSQPVSTAKYNRGHNENWPVPEQHFSQELRGASYLTSVLPPSQGTMNKQSTTKAIRATTNTAKTDPFVHFSPDDIPWIAQRTHKQGENGERAPKKQRVNSLPQDASWNDGVRPMN